MKNAHLNNESDFMIFVEGNLIGRITQFSQPKLDEILKIVHSYSDEYETYDKSQIHFKYKIDNKGIEVLTNLLYPRLDKSQREEIKLKILAIEQLNLYQLDFKHPYLLSLKERYLVNKIEVNNGTDGPFINYRGFHYNVNPHYDDNLRFHVLLGLFWGFNSESKEFYDKRTEFIKEIDSDFVSCQGKYPIVEYKDKFYTLNLLNDVKTQLENIKLGNTQSYNTYNIAKQRMKDECFYYFKELGFDSETRVYCNRKLIVTFTNVEPSKDEIIDSLVKEE